MARWRYIDQDGYHEITDEEILAEFYPYWAERMTAAGKADQITPDACRDDFVVVHWAWKVEE